MFQKTNKRITDATAKMAPADFPEDLKMELYCECANKACLERFGITPQEYAGVTEAPLAYAVKPEHYLPEFEQLVKKASDYWVIKKRAEKRGKRFEI